MSERDAHHSADCIAEGANYKRWPDKPRPSSRCCHRSCCPRTTNCCIRGCQKGLQMPFDRILAFDSYLSYCYLAKRTAFKQLCQLGYAA